MNFVEGKRKSAYDGVARMMRGSSETLDAAVDAKSGQRGAVAIPSNRIHVLDDKGLALQRCIQDADLPVPLAA